MSPETFELLASGYNDFPSMWALDVMRWVFILGSLAPFVILVGLFILVKMWRAE